MTNVRRVLVPALGVAVALAAALATTAGPHLSPWSTAQKVDEIAGNNAELNTEAWSRPRCAEPRHLGRPSRDQERSVRRARDPRARRQLDRRRLLPHADPRARTVLREPQDHRERHLRDGGHLLHALRAGPRLDAAGAPPAAPPTGRTPRWTSRVRRT
jgi:hypothetical protein